jgi:hypothetical protein
LGQSSTGIRRLERLGCPTRLHPQARISNSATRCFPNIGQSAKQSWLPATKQ